MPSRGMARLPVKKRMKESTSSLLILLGSVLVLALLWYLSYLFVRHDTARRGLSPLRRKVWLAAAIGLPLFGLALYLFAQILQGYLAPPETQDGAQPHDTDVKAGLRSAGPGLPATGSGPGTAEVYDVRAGPTPRTVSAFHQPLRGVYELVVTQGPYAGLRKPVERLPLRIGRGLDEGLKLENDLNVSREHAELYEWGGTLRIRDAGSTHGTQVNGVPVSDQAIAPGDRISVGGTTIILRERA